MRCQWPGMIAGAVVAWLKANFGLGHGPRDGNSGASQRQEGRSFTVIVSRSALKKAGLMVVFLWFAIGGIAHFAATRLEMSIVPPYIPWSHAAVVVSGAFELFGAAGLVWSATRRSAGWGLFALTIAVTPANVYMLQRSDHFGIPVWVLVARLFLQVGLLALILWSTRREPARA
jgi:uncharacterized membrane protein